MNKHIYSLSIVLMASLFGVVEGSTQPSRQIRQIISESPYNASYQARGIAFLFFNDKEAAVRYVKHADFYSQKTNRFLINDNIIDHCVYPVVDILVGRGMAKLNEFEYIHETTDNISPSNRKFLANSAQLVVSASAVKLISIESRKGVSNINQKDVKDFGKSCAAQVGCDIADEFVIKPVVKMLVEDDNSWTSCGLRGIGNYVLAGFVINQVSKF